MTPALLCVFTSSQRVFLSKFSAHITMNAAVDSFTALMIGAFPETEFRLVHKVWHIRDGV